MRNLGLDITRFVAIVLVLGRHLGAPPRPMSAVDIWKTGGWIGVDLFFVLSGFLIASSPVKNSSFRNACYFKSAQTERIHCLHPSAPVKFQRFQTDCQHFTKSMRTF